MSVEEGHFEARDLGNDPDVWRFALEQLGTGEIIFLATTGPGGARVRPVTVVDHAGGHYVLTGSGDAKVAQLRADPRFEAVRLLDDGEDKGSVRYRGEVEFVSDQTLRRAVFEESGFGDIYFDGPDDPGMSLLRLDIRGATIIRPRSWVYEVVSRD